MTTKIKKPLKFGEGTRERRPSVYGEGGRQNGGASAIHGNQAKASGKIKLRISPPRPSDKTDVKGRQTPPPAVQPKSLVDAAGKEGRVFSRTLTSDPFQRLKDETTRGVAFEEEAFEEPQDDALNNVQDELHPRAGRDRTLEEEEARAAKTAERRKNLAVFVRPPVVEINPQEGSVPGESNLAVATPEIKGPKTALESIHTRNRRSLYTPEQQNQITSILAGLPGVTCNNCPVRENCPEYQAGSTCAFNSDMLALPQNDVANFLPQLELIAMLQSKRALRGVLIEETLGGGILDPNVTRQLEVAAQASIRVAQHRMPMREHGPAIVVQQTNNNEGGGILSKLLDRMAAPAPQSIDLEVVPTTEPASLPSSVPTPDVITPAMEPEYEEALQPRKRRR